MELLRGIYHLILPVLNPILSQGVKVSRKRRFHHYYNFKKYLLIKKQASHFIGLGVLQILAIFELLLFLSFHNRQPVALETIPVTVQPTVRETSFPIEPLVKIPQFKGSQLFANADSIGAIALGMAEGTRTLERGFTSKYFGHRDYGNGKQNLGTFAYQHDASSPEEADLKQLKNLRSWTDQIQQEAKNNQVKWGLFEVLAGADLFNQAPAAGKYYVQHLKECQEQNKLEEDAVLCARVQSYYNPKTGELEAGGFDNDLEHLKLDQQRRLRAILTLISEDQFRASNSQQ